MSDYTVTFTNTDTDINTTTTTTTTYPPYRYQYSSDTYLDATISISDSLLDIPALIREEILSGKYDDYIWGLIKRKLKETEEMQFIVTVCNAPNTRPIKT